MNERTILHVDANNFYASVECMLHPELRGYPIAVCGDVEERHGIVLAKNYAAKAYGVSTGEAIWQAKQKCKDLIIVPPHYDDYMKISKAARDIYCDYTDKVEPFGMDECWLQLWAKKYDEKDGINTANAIRDRIKVELGITVSVGVSFNKVFAKLGSDLRTEEAPGETKKAVHGKRHVRRTDCRNRRNGMGRFSLSQKSGYTWNHCSFDGSGRRWIRT